MAQSSYTTSRDVTKLARGLLTGPLDQFRPTSMTSGFIVFKTSSSSKKSISPILLLGVSPSSAYIAQLAQCPYLDLIRSNFVLSIIALPPSRNQILKLV